MRRRDQVTGGSENILTLIFIRLKGSRKVLQILYGTKFDSIAMAPPETEVKTDSWEEFSKIASLYFTEPERYDISQSFDHEEIAYEMRFKDKERGRTASIKYDGNPQDTFQEGYYNMQKFLTDSTEFWADMLD